MTRQYGTQLRCKPTRAFGVSTDIATLCATAPTSIFTSYDPAWVDGLGRTVAEFRRTGATVLVLGPVIVGNDLVFRDDNHVTIAYAQALAPVLGALADQALV